LEAAPDFFPILFIITRCKIVNYFPLSRTEAFIFIVTFSVVLS